MVVKSARTKGYISRTAWLSSAAVTELARKRRYEAPFAGETSEMYLDDFDFSYYPEGAFPEKRKKSYREIAESTFQAALKFAEYYASNDGGKGLFIYGNVGSGKTYLCSAIANYLLEKEKEVLFIVVPDLLDEIRASYSGDSEFSEIQVLGYAVNAPVLILTI